MPTTNVCTNPSFETGTTGWAYNWFGSGSGAGTNDLATTGGASGPQYIRKTWSTSPPSNADIGFNYTDPSWKAGITRSVGVLVYITGAAGRRGFLRVVFNDSSNSAIAQTASPYVTLSSGGWTFLTFPNVTAPTGTASAKVNILLFDGPVMAPGDVMGVDAFMLADTSTLPTNGVVPAGTGPATPAYYFDGSTPRSGAIIRRWSGTANASTSIQQDCLNAKPDITATPPRMQLTIASLDGSTITAVTLSRTVNGTTTPTRTQPAPGPSPITVYDYESAWDTNVTYTATITASNGTNSYTNTPVVLSPTSAWMIHPTAPALSCLLDSGNYGTAGVVSISDVARPSTTVQHDIIGSPYRLVTRSGPRNASRTQIVYQTTTELERSRFVAMITDQTPILIREPAAFNWAFEDGYYDIGDVTEARFSPVGNEPRRNFTIPIERVDTPAGTQASIRTYADVLNENASYQAVTAGYASYTDLLTNTRR